MEKSRGNFSSFIEEYNKIQNILYGTENEIKVEVHTFKKYLTDNKENIELMKELLTSEGKQSLAIGKAGKGKTFLANTCFQELAKEATDNDVYIIFLPGTAQTSQLNKEYNMISVVGKTPDIITYNFKESKIFGVVYDKATDIDEIYKRFPNLKIHALVDETHNSVSQSGFRHEVIEGLEYFKNQILAHKGSVVLLTATPQVVQYEKFDRIIDFEEEGEYTAPTKEFNIFVNSNCQDFKAFALAKIKEIGKNQIIRYNSKDAIDSIALELSNDSKVLKSYRGLEKNNVVLNQLIETSVLPEHDYILTTSLIDCGINIKKDRDEALTFVIPNANNMNLLDIEQFLNRLRGTARSYNIIIDNGKAESYQVYQKGKFSEFVKNNYKEVDEQIKLLNMLLSYLKFKYKSDEANLRKEFEHNLEFVTLEGKRNDLGCIFLNQEGNIDINKKKMFYKSFREYNSQFYYNLKSLKDALEELFNIEINIFEDDGTYEELTSLEGNSIEIMKTKSLEEVEKDVNLNYVKRSTIYKQIKEFVLLGENEKEVKEFIFNSREEKENISKVLKATTEEINNLQNIFNDLSDEERELKVEELQGLYKKKNDAEKAFKDASNTVKEAFRNASKEYLTNLSESNIEATERIYNEYNEDDLLINDTSKVVLNSYYGSEIRKALDSGYSLKETIEVISNSKKDITISNYFNLRQYIYMNNAFLNDRELLNTKAGEEYETIVSYFFYNNGNSRNKVLTEKNLDELSSKLGDKYTIRKLLKVICLAFNISDKTNAPTSLRKEYKSEYLI